jgi:hypothetical protein
VYQSLKGDKKVAFMTNLQTKGKKDLSWVDSFSEDHSVFDRTLISKKDGLFTMYEIFAFNKVDTHMVDDVARRGVVLKCLLEENSKEHGYAPEKKEGLCVELNRYRYIYFDNVDEHHVDNGITFTKTLQPGNSKDVMQKMIAGNGMTPAPDSLEIKLENPMKHELMCQVTILRSAVVALDKKLIDLRELKYDIDVQAHKDTQFECPKLELETILHKLDAFISAVREFNKNAHNEDNEAECKKLTEEAKQMVVACTAHCDGHKDMKKRHLKLLSPLRS